MLDGPTLTPADKRRIAALTAGCITFSLTAGTATDAGNSWAANTVPAACAGIAIATLTWFTLELISIRWALRKELLTADKAMSRLHHPARSAR